MLLLFINTTIVIAIISGGMKEFGFILFIPIFIEFLLCTVFRKMMTSVELESY